MLHRVLSTQRVAQNGDMWVEYNTCAQTHGLNMPMYIYVQGIKIKLEVLH